MKLFPFALLVLLNLQGISQTCFTIGNRTNGNGNSNTCGTPSCSGNSKTGHIDVNFGAACPSPIPALVLTSVTIPPFPSPFCFDAGNCLGTPTAGTVRYCFRGSNLPNTGRMVLSFTQGATTWSCDYDVNGGSGVVLPITLSHFSAALQQGSVNLVWTTQQEVNSKEFIIEHSADNRVFTAIGTVTAAGNSGVQKNYQFTDTAPVNGKNFYRFKQVDLNGLFTYSVVKAVDIRVKGIQVTSMGPNPCKNVICFTFSLDKKTLLQAQFFNSMGMLVIKQQKTAAAGLLQWQFNTQHLNKGIYHIIFSNTKGEKFSEKIFID